MFALRRDAFDISANSVNSRRLTAAGTRGLTLRRLTAAGYSPPLSSPLSPHPSPRGITLIELLVVITILTTMAVVAIPRMRPMMENHHLREAARGLNVFLSQVRIRAIETGRPCGVLFERAVDRNQRNACTVMRQVEIPPPYAGSTLDARVRFQLGSFNPTTGLVVVQATAAWSFPSDLIRVGDSLQINHQGPWYEITQWYDSTVPAWVDSGYIADFPIELRTNVGPAGSTPWSATPSAPLPFTILRQPSFDETSRLVSAFGSITPSLQLPRGAVIDLGASGHGDGVQFRPKVPTTGYDNTPVILMFSPTGSVDRVYRSRIEVDGSGDDVIRYRDYPITQPIFLLVGRWDRATDAGAEDGLENWQDLTNYWLAVSTQTGMATVAEVHGDYHYAATDTYLPGDPEADLTDPAVLANQISNARQYAREVQFSKGGR